MERGSTDAKMNSWILIALAVVALVLDLPGAAAILLVAALGYGVAESICKSIEWAAERREQRQAAITRGRYEPGKDGPIFDERDKD